ncbi:MAG: hypothetical protein EXQ70_05760 [Solirubrobacterales bacterium]|nr:hypothetical protein [Solirubrobacterales bacterium]
MSIRKLERGAQRRPQTRRAAAAAAGLVLGMALAMLLPGAAHAGLYSVLQCHPEQNATHEATFARSSDRYRSRASCRQGANGLEVSHEGSGTKDGRLGAWTWLAPAGTVIRGVALRAQLQSGGGHAAQLVVGSDDGTASYFGRIEDRWRDEFWSGSGGRWLRGRLRCYGGSDGVCDRAEGAHVWLQRVRLTLFDSAGPTLSLAGAMFDPGARSGHQTLNITAADQGSGLRRIDVWVNGVATTARQLDCALGSGWAKRLRPCPSSVTTPIVLDTAAAPFRNGANEVSACVSDLATSGAPNLGCATRSVTVDNACPSSRGGGRKLSAGFAGGGVSTTVRAGQKPKLIGRLLSASGSPLEGARVCLLARPAMPSGEWKRIGMPRTHDDGRFSFVVPAGPSRDIRVAYRADSLQLEQRLRLAVRANPKLAVSPARTRNGRRVRFRGVLPGPSNSGRAVALQALAEGRWLTFAVARSRLRGRFTSGYRFRSTSAPTTYRFRALVKAQAGYPYLQGISRVRTVRIG